MSFYGSVYYQFIDNFYKVIFHNTDFNGLSIPEFPTQEQIKQEDSVQAQGRKGIINLKPGNRWIQFTKDADTDQIKLWHGKPVNTEKTRKDSFYGFKPVLENKLPEGVSAIELKEGDYFTTIGMHYDHAGHIIYDSDDNEENGREEIYFKLPESEKLQNLKKLNNFMGWDEEGTGFVDDEDNKLNDYYENTNISKKVYDNDNEVKTKFNNLDEIDNKLLALYSDVDEDNQSYFFGEKTGNFPKNFGNIDDIKNQWQNIINGLNHSDIYNFILNNEDFNKYCNFDLENKRVTIKDISSVICLIAGVILAVDSNTKTSINNINENLKTLSNDIETLQVPATVAANALGQYGLKNSGGAYIFNNNNTIAETLGVETSENQGIKKCYFDSNNTVYNAIKALEARIAALENK